ncbi:MAG: RbsD/FucU family protein [Eubacteriales bacterium]|jgi:L-fucose mutarotase|nr:RbsD/FucU family protein [Eubacteriales bacterium]MDD4711514.1 RbsD/FucU family protein [Eubacteriales bacterium]
MLRGIPDIIGSDLLKALADTGHGDLIVIADHFYPPITKSPNAVSIQAKGCGAAQMLDAILKLVPLDAEYEKHPISYMVPDADSGVVMESSPVWEGVKEAVVKNGYDVSVVGEIERTKFYEKAAKAYITVCTSEQKPYGCIILQKGVL